MTDERMTYLLAAIQDHSGMDRAQVREAGEHGADANWPGFSHTRDGADFTEWKRDLVWSLLSDDAEAMGFDSVPAFVASFVRADMADDQQGFDCLLAWYALETVGRWVADNERELAEADEDAMRTSGEAAGKAAGSWVVDGNSTEAQLRAVIRADEDCEFDSPNPLSGEWADGWTEDAAFEDADVVKPEDNDERAPLINAWEDAFRTAYVDEAVRSARAMLPDDDEPDDDDAPIIPEDFPVQPISSNAAGRDVATCGVCGLSWDDGQITSMTPAPSARCPFEAFHKADDDDDDDDEPNPARVALTRAVDNALAAGAPEYVNVPVEPTPRLCLQCDKPMNPAEWSICGSCCRKNHAAAVRGL